MGVIVIAIAMAVPAIRYLTGSKSEQAAQNAVTAMLARARSDAIALQTPQGVLFTIDQATDRVMMYQVVKSPPPVAGSPDPVGITYLDLTPDRDPLLLPTGIRALTIKDTYHPTAPVINDPFPPYRYLGYNDATSNSSFIYDNTPTQKALLGGVILFDAQGNLLVTRYGFRYTATTLGSAGPVTGPTALTGAIFLGAPTNVPTSIRWPDTTNYYIRSQVGLVLVDKDSFHTIEQQAYSGQVATGLDSNPVTPTNAAEQMIDQWLDQNATPLLVNPYSGTLTRAE